jgi:hypothetical protein
MIKKIKDFADRHPDETFMVFMLIVLGIAYVMVSL